MLQIRLPEFDNPLGFMAYAMAVLDQHQLVAAFPGAIYRPIPIFPVLPAVPTAAQSAVNKEALRVFAAYTNSLTDLKFALEYFFETDVVHLRHELTQYYNVTAAQLYDAAFANHGTPQTEDIDRLRDLTLLPCDRSLTAEENIVQFLARHKALTDQGADYATNSGQKLIEATKFISAMAPATKTIVDKYYADTDFQARTADALLAAARDGLRRLPVQPDLAAIRSVYSVVHQGWEFHAAAPSTAYVAVVAPDIATALVAQNSKGKGGKKRIKSVDDMTLDELKQFYQSRSVTHYCFHHGWGNHPGEKNATSHSFCSVMNNDAKFTPAMKALKKPTYQNGVLQPVDGLLPSVFVYPGFRKPN
jgi:hypothetical protein